MYFVDSHCHLEFPEFGGKCQEILEQATLADVKTFLTIGTRIETMGELLKLINSFPQIYGAVGIHPHESHSVSGRGVLETFLDEHLHNPRVVGVGETGLDFYYEHSPRDLQSNVFRTHLKKALEVDLPVIVHTRDAEKETVAILKEAAFEGVKGVIHCFTGSQWLAEQVLDLGFFISFSGVITFKNAQPLRDLIPFVPLDRILVETDSPFLAPIPHRGKTNQPAFVVHVAEKIAELKSVSLEEVARVTTENFFRLFEKATPVPTS
ncbi:MAG: TatD family hydrolase [Alphaproteobacteria bacterium]